MLSSKKEREFLEDGIAMPSAWRTLGEMLSSKKATDVALLLF
jgi:hypothetical protein